MRLLRAMLAFTAPLALVSACTNQVDETCGGRGAASGSAMVSASRDPKAPLAVQRAQAAVVCDADAIATRITAFTGQSEEPAAKRLRKLARAALDDLSARPPESSRFPASVEHEQMYAIAAEAERAQGSATVLVWRADPWQQLTPLDRSDSDDTAIALALMRGEHRAAALNVRSVAPTTRELQVTVSIPQLPREALQVYRANWIGTDASDWSAAELERLGDGEDAQRLTLSPGITQQIWLRVAPPRSVAPGRYSGSINLAVEGESPVQAPIAIEVFKTEFPQRPALHFGGWDYTDELGHGYALTELNRPALIEHLQSRHVDTPWAHGNVLNWRNIDEQGQLTAPLDSQLLADWIANWPQARRFRVYMDFGADTVGPDPAFSTKVARWARAWADEIRRLNRSPEQFDLLIVDEPKTPEQIRTTVSWAKAIKDSGAGFRIWTDPNWEQPWDIPQELIEAADTLAIYLGYAERGGAVYWEWARRVQAAGKSVEIYAYDGPVHRMDPYRYYRLSAWRAVLAGLDGVTFWSFSDTGGSPSDNAFAAEKVNYAPLFVNAASVNAGRHMEAAAEGIQDAEYLRMLQQLTAHGDASVRSAAQELLTDVDAFLSEAGPSSNSSWGSQRECVQADRLRTRIGALLDSTAP